MVLQEDSHQSHRAEWQRNRGEGIDIHTLKVCLLSQSYAEKRGVRWVKVTSRTKRCLVRGLKQTITPDITYPGCQGHLNNKDKTHHNQRNRNVFYGSYSTWSGAIELDYHASPVFSLKVKILNRIHINLIYLKKKIEILGSLIILI